MIAKSVFIAGILLQGLVLAGCQTTQVDDVRARAQKICDYEPAAYGFIVAVNASAHLDPVLMSRVRTAHQVVTVVCNPLPSDVTTVLQRLQSAWAIISGAQDSAESANAQSVHPLPVPVKH